jgi:hypothetical protein
MDSLGWVCFSLVVLPVPFLFWFGIIPLWVDRRLRRSGEEVMGRCRTISTSEGRYSTSFEFSTRSGDRVIYISPLSGSTWGTPGEEALLVYDPSSPWRRVRSRRELESRSEAWASLWWLILLETLMAVIFVLYLSY